MMQFYETYRGLPKLAPLVRVLSWTHNLLIMSRTAYRRNRKGICRTPPAVCAFPYEPWISATLSVDQRSRRCEWSAPANTSATGTHGDSDFQRSRVLVGEHHRGRHL